MKKITLTLQEIFDIPDSVIFNPDSYEPVSAVSIDSRNLPLNALFAAIKGERFDGHDFVNDAIKNGASAIMVNNSWLKSISETDIDKVDIPIIAVENTTKAYGEAARIWRRKLNAKVIAITGSSGKTSTKEMLAMMLSEKFNVNRTLANNNNHLGVPLTIFSTSLKHEVLVLELGTNHFGEIEYISKIAEPDYAMITNIGNSHIEFLKNKKGVLKEKAVLFDVTAARGGVLIVNNDDDYIKNLRVDYKKRITYGFINEADIKGLITGYDDEGKAKIEAKYKNKKLKLSFPLYGEHSAQNFIAAASAAFKLGLTKDEVINGVTKLKAIDKRLNVKRLKDNLLIDDTYNANPESMKYAIELLPRLKMYSRKVVVLGDMFELGDDAAKHHARLAGVIKRNKVDKALLLGRNMKHLHNALAGTKTETVYFKDRKGLLKHLDQTEINGAAILVKGSRGMKMEEFTNVIIEKYK